MSGLTELVLVDENDDVGRSRGSDETGVCLEVEVVGERMGDSSIDDRTGSE